MKLAIMQPYIFPYLGYFQLINAVDKFVLYDDVAYIKQGWINRNRILLNNEAFLFTLPVSQAASSKRIKDVVLPDQLFRAWRNKFYKTLEVAYSKAPYYADVFSLITDILNKESNNIGELAGSSVLDTMKYLGIATAVVPSSAVYRNEQLQGKERVIDICEREAADCYINAPGGTALYDKENFQFHKILLQFIRPGDVIYEQFSNDFVPWLSIIDVMMFNAPQSIKTMLGNYTLE